MDSQGEVIFVLKWPQTFWHGLCIIDIKRSKTVCLVNVEITNKTRCTKGWQRHDEARAAATITNNCKKWQFESGKNDHPRCD